MKKDEFKPYIPADKITPEFTVTSVIMGVLLAIIFGAANAYLGLRVGMTVSASIPAAVISMGVIRVIMKKDSILESNMVQTIGSAGESLDSGSNLYTSCIVFMVKGRDYRDSKPDYHFINRIIRRYLRCVIYGAVKKCTDCKRTRCASVSGRYSLCGSSFSR